MAALKFWKNGMPCEVTLQTSSVHITYLKTSCKQVTVDIPHPHLLALEQSHNDDDDSSSIIVHYVRPVNRCRLRMDSVSVQADQHTCERLVKALEPALKCRECPKRVAVIINPNSGKKRAEKIFYKQVQPLFKLCGIDTRVIVTKEPKEARDLLQTMDLRDMDGVVTVGGDGLYCEVMTGLILRTQTDHGVNVHDPEVKVIPSRLPIGVIPAGTGNMLVQYLHGTCDVITGALRVVLGSHVATNVVSVHQGAHLSAYAGLVLGFGLQGDMMADCERFRWMGQRRYNVIPIRTVLSRRSHHVQVDYTEVDNGHTHRTSAMLYSVDTYVVAKEEAAAPMSRKEAGHPSSMERAGDVTSKERDLASGHMTFKDAGDVVVGQRPGHAMPEEAGHVPSKAAGHGVCEEEGQRKDVQKMSLEKGKEGSGPGLRQVFGADTLTVYMTHKCSLGSHIQQLSKLKDNVSGTFDYDFVQKARVEAYTVRFPHAATIWQGGHKVLKDHFNVNCDGEVLKIIHPEFQVRLHRHAIRLFGEAVV